MRLSIYSLFFLIISANSYAKDEITINEISLIGDIDSLLLPAKKLAIKMDKFIGDKSVEEFTNIVDEFEQWLNNQNSIKYNVKIPKQSFRNGKVYLVLKSELVSKILYTGTNSFSDENIRNSLPSLGLDKFYEDGRQWFDPRELTMAQENPLKLTLLNYDLSPEAQSSVLTVYSYAPYGNKYTYVTIDNYGSKSLDYGRINVGHINANLTGKDDVLSITGVTNFKRPEDYYALGVNYLYPFYKQHQTLGLNVFYSHINSDENSGLANGLDRKTSSGNSLTAVLNWNYYLPQFGIGVKDQFKLNIAYTYRYFDQRSSLEANKQVALDQKQNFSLGSLSIGFSGEIKPTTNSEIKFNLSQAYYSHKLLGSQHISHLTEQGYARDYNLTSYNLSYSQNIANWNFKTELFGQYTHNKIPSIEYQSVTGIYNVRGFKYNNLSADKGFIWRTEMTTPSYTSFNLKNYIFYDWGKFSYNDSNRLGSIISSTGLGIKGEITKGLNFDIFVAKRLHNAKFDRLDSGKISDKTTILGKISYGF